MLRLALSTWVACMSPTEPPAPPTSTSTTGETGTPTESPEPTETGTPTSPVEDALVVHVWQGLPYGQRAVLVFSDPDGAWLRTIEIDRSPIGFPTEEVPVGGYVTYATWRADEVTLETFAEVRVGQELWFRNADLQWGLAGQLQWTVPSSPPGVWDTIHTRTNCFIEPRLTAGTVRFPHSGVLSIREQCVPHGAMDLFVAARQNGLALPTAIWYDSDIPFLGKAPTLTGEAAVGQWDDAYPVQQVTYTHGGAPADMVLSAVAMRQGAMYDAARGDSSTDMSAKAQLQVQLALPTDFFDEAVVTLRQDGAFPTRSASRILRTPRAGVPAPIVLGEADARALPTTMSVDLDAWTADLTLPKDWDCAGRGPTHMQLIAQGNEVNPFRRFQWDVFGPYRTSTGFPSLGPDVQALIDDIGLYSINALAYSAAADPAGPRRTTAPTMETPIGKDVLVQCASSVYASMP